MKEGPGHHRSGARCWRRPNEATTGKKKVGTPEDEQGRSIQILNIIIIRSTMSAESLCEQIVIGCSQEIDPPTSRKVGFI